MGNDAHDPQEILRLARIISANAHSDQIRVVKSELEQLLMTHPGSREAEEAIAILARFEEAETEIPRVSGQVSEWQRKISDLRGLDDGRLHDYLLALGRLDLDTQARLSREARLFQDWLVQGLDDFERAREPMGDNRLSKLEEFAQALNRIEGFRNLLSPQLIKVQEVAFAHRLNAATQKIELALSEWRFDDAWAAFQPLENPPPSHLMSVQTLREKIIGAGQISDEAKLLADKKLPKIKKWRDADLACEIACRMKNLIESSSMPEPWFGDISNQLREIITEIANFLEGLAKDAKTLAQFDDLETSYDLYVEKAFGSELRPQESLFHPGLARLEKDLDTQITKAASPDALMVLAESLPLSAYKLPDLVKFRLSQRLTQIQQVYSAWTGMRIGREFHLLEEESIVVPRLFRDQASQFQEWLDNIETSERLLRKGGPELTSTIHLALQTVAGIFTTCPNHERAKVLEKEARAIQRRQQMDEALRRLDLNAFLEHHSHAQGDGLYDQLASEKKTLKQLISTCQSEPDFDNFNQTIAWLREWRDAYHGLPKQVPRALLEWIITKRLHIRTKWHSGLTNLANKNHTPDEWERMVKDLAAFSEEFELKSFEQQFSHAAMVGFIEQDLNSSMWREAESRLSRLDNADKDRIRLTAKLKYNRAKLEGQEELAEVLLEDWSLFTRAFPQDKLYDLVLEALENAWQGNLPVPLDKWHRLVERVLQESSVVPPWRGQFIAWRDWLRLEKALSAEVTLAHIEALFQLSKPTLTDIKKSWFNRLVKNWKETHKLSLGIWGQVIFGDKLSTYRDYQPLAELDNLTLARIREIHDELGQMHAPDVEIFSRQQASLNKLRQTWEKVLRFLEVTPTKFDYPKPPAALGEMDKTLSLLLSTIQKLESFEKADLRTVPPFELNMLFRRSSEFKLETPNLADGLRNRTSRLLELQGLDFNYRGIRSLAKRCADLEVLDELGLFNRLARDLEHLATLFVKMDGTTSYFYGVLTKESLDEIPGDVGVLDPNFRVADLQGLINALDTFQANEDTYRNNISLMIRSEPIGLDIMPGNHKAYLNQFPKQAPITRRVFRLFDQYAQRRDVRHKLEQCRADLPRWISGYLDGGFS